MWRELYWKTGLKSDAVFFYLAGLFFALLGIVLSKIIFAQNIGLVAVFLAALAAISLVDKQLSLSEYMLTRLRPIPLQIQKREDLVQAQDRATIKSIFHDHYPLFKTYFFLFLGVMTCFSILTLLVPESDSNALFGEQFKTIFGRGAETISNSSTGYATNWFSTFYGLLSNNLVVLVVAFGLALVFEFGTTFLIIWNASVWGTAFAFAAKTTTILLHEDPILNFLFLMAIVFPHLVLEALAYFSATIGGGLLNKALLAEPVSSFRFKLIASRTLLLFVLGVCLLGAAAGVETLAIIFLRG